MARTDPHNLSRYWWDRHTPGLSLMCADFTTQAYPPHTHDGFVIAVTEAGGSVIKSRGVVEEARSSTLFVFNPAEAHAGWMGHSERWRYRSFYLTQSAIDAVARGLGVAEVPYFTRNRFGDADLVDGFLALHRALEDGRDLFRERELLVSTFGRLYRRHGSGGGRIEAPPRDRALLRLVTDLVHQRHAEDLRLEDLSAAAGLTPFQLIGLFKRGVGMTPHAYLVQARLKRACHYLRRGMPIAQVAGATGFYDQSALTRHFKRCYGITPLQFARAAQHGGRPV
ncbi:helix-turn-helix domain-containing protein [Bordetella petrii]|uniref:AraC family transcriptional regulator n=1 Tax=Bordetella petrii TaxID=94624 RepID=A0ABT7W4M9_9BORD|nr:AraC family transcriptional regulator [Bordetella petrii]MDM9560119.1 AraC family transcriptional regulator [Bordetella petrii]